MNTEYITDQAIKFARKNKESIAAEFADVTKFTPDDHPISVFMAGSPGAGKTEFSKNLITILEALNYETPRNPLSQSKPNTPAVSGFFEIIRIDHTEG